MKKYIIFGTGNISEDYFNKLAKLYGEEMIFCFLDSLLNKETFCNKPVKKLGELKNIEVNNYQYVLGSLTNKKSMIGELKKYGVKEENIIIDRDYGPESFEKNVKIVKKVAIFPNIDNLNYLNELNSIIEYLLPNRNQLEEKINIVVSKNIIRNINENNFLIKEKIDDLSRYDLILVWNQDFLDKPELRECKNVYCIDPYYFPKIDMKILLYLNYLLADKEKEFYWKQSTANFNISKSKITKNRAYVFGQGPSCREEIGKIPEGSLKIACNSMVKCKDIISKIKPNFYAIADEIMLSHEFSSILDEIILYISNHECYLVVPDIIGFVLVKRYPDSYKKMIMLSFQTEGICFPTPDNMKVYRKAYNVITAISLPIASALCDTIYIVGCDGIKKNLIKDGIQKWDYCNDIDEDNSKIKVRMREIENKKEYYLKHNVYFQEFIEYGETKGKKYISLTKSYIPVLEQRIEKKI